MIHVTQFRSGNQGTKMRAKDKRIYSKDKTGKTDNNNMIEIIKITRKRF